MKYRYKTINGERVRFTIMTPAEFKEFIGEDCPYLIEYSYSLNEGTAGGNCYDSKRLPENNRCLTMYFTDMLVEDTIYDNKIFVSNEYGQMVMSNVHHVAVCDLDPFISGSSELHAFVRCKPKTGKQVTYCLALTR